MSNLVERVALTLPVEEANVLRRRVRFSAFLLNRGITLVTEPAEPFVNNDGTRVPTVALRVQAETELACGMGCGFLVAVSEGVHELGA